MNEDVVEGPLFPDLTVKIEGVTKMAAIEIFRNCRKSEIIKRIMKYRRLHRDRFQWVVIVGTSQNFSKV